MKLSKKVLSSEHKMATINCGLQLSWSEFCHCYQRWVTNQLTLVGEVHDNWKY